jgi:hypothetical protein
LADRHGCARAGVLGSIRNVLHLQLLRPVVDREYAIAWAQMVLANLGQPREKRTAWPELFSQFKNPNMRNQSNA